MAAMMRTTPCSGDDATPHGDDATLDACLATMMARLGDDANLDNDATPLGACSVMTTPSSETLGNNTQLGYNFTLGDNVTAC